MRSTRIAVTKWERNPNGHRRVKTNGTSGRPKGALSKYAGNILQVSTTSGYDTLLNDGCFVRRNHLCE